MQVQTDTEAEAPILRLPDVKNSLIRKDPNAELFTIVHSSTDERIKKLWYKYTMEYYSAIIRNAFESILMRWMNLEPITQSEVNQKNKHHILMHTHGI